MFKSRNGHNGRKNPKQYKESYNMDELLDPIETTDEQNDWLSCIQAEYELKEMQEKADNLSFMQMIIQEIFDIIDAPVNQ